MIRIKHINAFTTQPFHGNPAAVVTRADALTEDQMQKIAREMNLADTAFVLRPSRSAADLRLRWFTPTTEVSFCGHATIASFHALAEERRFSMARPGQYSFKLETRSGILPVCVMKGSSRKAWVQLQLPPTRFSSYRGPLVQILKGLRVDKKELHPRLPVQIDSRRMLYLPFGRLKTVLEMKPNFECLRQIGEHHRLHGVCVFTPETIDEESTFHSRFFAPNYGINEDPVTGSSNGPLAAYFYAQGLLPSENEKCRAIGEQGDVLGRKGRVSVEVNLDREEVASVRIGGEAVTIFEVPLRLS